MSQTYTPSKTIGDLMLQEVLPSWTKGGGLLAAGHQYEIGAVLAKVGNKYQLLDPAGSGAAKKAVAVLGEAINARAGDVPSGVIIKRGAVLADSALVWPAGATEAQKLSALDELEALGIVVKSPL